MGRVLIALLSAVWLVPSSAAAQSNSLPSTAFGGSEVFRPGPSTFASPYDRRFSRQAVPGWYSVAGLDASDQSPVTTRYMSRGEIDPVPSYLRGHAPVVVPRSAYPDYLDHTLTRISYRPVFVPVYYSVPGSYAVPVSYSRYPRWSFGHAGPVVRSAPATYVIPGCYMGDAPPLRPEKLPAGCKIEDLKKVYH